MQDDNRDAAKLYDDQQQANKIVRPGERPQASINKHTRHQQQIIEMNNNTATAIDHNNNNNNINKSRYRDDLILHNQQECSSSGDVIKEFCPLVKHNKLQRSKLSIGALLPPQMRAPIVSLDHKSRFMATASRVVSIKGNNAVQKLFDTSSSSSSKSHKPLRQINIVGQLNHSASKGFLLIMALVSLAMVAHQIEASVWPFSVIAAKQANGGSTHTSQQSKLWPLQGSKDGAASGGAAKRKARHSGSAPLPVVGPAGVDRDGPLPAPLSQQYHYFWNHDKLEPSVMATEANKILVEAQSQTNQLAALAAAAGGPQTSYPPQTQYSRADTQYDIVSAGKAAAEAATASRQADPMQGSASSPMAQMLAGGGASGEAAHLIPPQVQQQLTAMVLQMQRQQQASMAMQPRFAMPAQAAVAAAQRRFAAVTGQQPTGGMTSLFPHSLMNPMSQYWMSGSSQHPVIAAPPTFGQMMAASDSQMQTANSGGPYMAAPGAPPPTSATMAGVPVFGPFMVGPVVSPAAAAMGLPAAAMAYSASSLHPMMYNAIAMQQPSAKPSGHHHHHSSPANRLTSSFMNRRKSWPLFGFGALSDKVSLLGSGSQPRISVASPPSQSQQQSQAASQQMAALESMALMDLASSQLASVFANQVQNRLAQQKLAIALARAFEQPLAGSSPDMMDTSASVENVQHATPRAVSAARKQLSLQAPYSMPSLLNHPASVERLAQSSFAEQPSQSFDISSVASQASNVNLSGPTYGNRLKRRQLSPSMAQQQQHSHNKQPAAQKSPVKKILAAGSAQPANVSQVIDISMDTNWSIDNIPRPQFFYTSPAADTQDNNRMGKSMASEGAVSKNPPSILVARGEQMRLNDLHPAASTGSARKKDISFLDANKQSHKQSGKAKKANVGSSSNNNNNNNKSNTHHLFMVMRTETPPTNEVSFIDINSNVTADDVFIHDHQQDTSGQGLRRLKRSSSASFSKRSNAINEIAKPSEWAGSSSWKSMPSSEIERPLNASLSGKSAAFSSFKPVEPSTATLNSQAQHSFARLVTPATKTSSLTDIKKAGNGWSSIEPASVAVFTSPQTLIKRSDSQLAVQNNTSSVANSDTRTGGEGGTTTPAPSSSGARQDRSLKVKRISASVSVLHHPVSSKSGHDKQTIKPNLIVSGTPVALKITKSTPELQTADPMSASISESARVNYFKNVDNEKGTSGGTEEPEAGSSNSGGQQRLQLPQMPQSINVGFSGPTKLVDGDMFMRQNGSDDLSLVDGNNNNNNNNYAPESVISSSNDLVRQSTKQHMGNSLGPNYHLGADHMDGGSQSQGGPQSSMVHAIAALTQLRGRQSGMYHHQQQQQQQSQAGAHNADISSSATRNVPYTINNMLPADLGGQQHQQSSQKFSNSQQDQGGLASLAGQQAMVTGQTGTGNHARGGSIIRGSADSAKSSSSSLGSLQGKIINAFLNLGDKSQQRSASSISSSSSIAPVFGATSQTRQSVVAPSSKPSKSSSSASASRGQVAMLSSADQSNSYANEEMLSPSGSNIGQSMFGPSAGGPTSQRSMYGSISDTSGPEQQPQQRGTQGQSYASSMDPSGAMDQSTGEQMTGGDQIGNNLDTNSGNMGINYGDNSFGSRNTNNGPSSMSDGLPPNGVYSSMEQYNQQQSMQRQQSNGGNQQQQQQQQMFGNMFGNQTDNLIPDGQDPSASLPFGSAGSALGGFGGGQGSFGPQTTVDDGSQMIQNNQPMMAPQQQSQQQQLYSQQMQQALTNFNQRFNQQFQDPSMMRNPQQQFSNQNTRNMFSQSMEQPMRAAGIQQAYPPAGMPVPNSALWTGVDEEAAANAAAAAGIPTYPNAAQLMAMQQGQFGDNMNGMQSIQNMIATGTGGVGGTDQRSGDEDGSVKKAKKKSTKQVNHYHFNNFGSPFEEDQFAQLQPYELGGALPLGQDGALGLAPARPKPKPKPSDDDKEKEKEEEKPKKRGFLRRFSFKNLFKRFRKDKKGNGGEKANSSNNNNESSSER